MILTQDKINNAVLKAFCAIGSKSFKYYRGLAAGTKNDCLLKEATLLNEYIDSIKCFKIIGSTEQCDCCIEGDYKVILPNNKVYYFQFNCDGTGYLLTEDNGGYDFTYCYDEANNQLVMIFDVDYNYQSFFAFGNSTLSTSFTVYLNSTIIYGNSTTTYNDFIDEFNTTNDLGYTLTNDGSNKTIITENGSYTQDDIEILDGDSVFNLILGMTDEGPLVLTYEDVDFTEECNFTYNGGFPWYYQSELDVTAAPILTEDGLISIKDPLGSDIVTPLVIPSALLTNPQDIVDYWNANRASTNFTLSYNGSEYVMESPADFVNYYSHTFNFTQYQVVNVPVPGVNATASATNTYTGSNQRINSTIKALVNGSPVGLYTIQISDTSDTAAQLAVKLENALTYTGASSVAGATINLISPVANATYNGYIFRLERDVIASTEISFVTPPIAGDTINVILNSDSQLVGQITVVNPLLWALDLANSINTIGHLGIQAYQLGGTKVYLLAPPLSGTLFNGETITVNVVGTGVINTLSPFSGGSVTPVLINENPFAGGVNPSSTPTNEFFTYTSNFDIIVNDELTYENLNPCTPQVIEQTCLTNEQVITIINNINNITQ
jgi:hypothetical protein